MQPDQLTQIQTGLTELNTLCGTVRAEVNNIRADFDNTRRQWVALGGQHRRIQGFVSNECATWLAAAVVLHGISAGKMDRLTEVEKTSLIKHLLPITGYQTHAALTTSDIPLPVNYAAEVAELVAAYGAARRYGTIYPLGTGTTKLPRLQTSPTFGFIAMSGAVPEKVPQIGFVDFVAQKAGGLVRVPSEIDADSIVALGQFIARYAAREMAKWEDTVFFIADGTGTYNSLKGIVKEVVDQAKVETMTTGNTAISQSTLANFRALRARPDAATLNSGAAYYMHPSMEQKLVAFNTAGDKPYTTEGGPMNARLDGWPIRWVDVMPPFSASAQPSLVFAVFGDISFWYLGLRAGFSLDTSQHVFFSTDEIAVRALERFTIGMMAAAAMGGLRTAAS